MVNLLTNLHLMDRPWIRTLLFVSLKKRTNIGRETMGISKPRREREREREIFNDNKTTS